MSNYKWQNIEKLGLCIVAFEATEHLANIISELRDVVDYVSIGLQRISYHGDPIDQIDVDEIFRLRDEDKLVDNIIEISLDSKKEPRVQETDKRNILIQDAEDHGCSHVLVIDSDEYYIKRQFIKALEEIDKNDYEITYCQYVNYYHDYLHYLVYPFSDGMYVPFVTKTKYRHSFECQDFPLPSDPTRRYVRPFTYDEKTQTKTYLVDYHIFEWKQINMHHLSCLRADIRKKFNSWSSKALFEDYNDLIDRAVDDYEHFDEHSKETQWAHLLFNTPDHRVKVNSFPKQFVQPKFDFRTRLRSRRIYKKIAILNMLSTNSNVDLFNKLAECGKQTWAKDVVNGKYPNIEYWDVIDWNKNSHIDLATHTIYVKTDYSKDNIEQLLNRFLEAYRLLSYIGYYDWVLRTNPSTWNNIDLINEFLANETSDFPIYSFNFFATFYSRFKLYASGASMIIPTRNIPILEKLYNSLSPDQKNATDDVLLSALWRLRAERIGLKDPHSCFHSFDGLYFDNTFENSDFNYIDFSKPMIQIKTFKIGDDINNGENADQIRIENDIQKMKKIQECWDSIKYIGETLEEFEQKLRNNMDKTIRVSKYSNEDFAKLTPKEQHSALYDNIMPYNKETLQYMENLSK